MSSQQVNVVEPGFLSTDILTALGKEGIIIMVVALFLILVLVVCCIALIVWYCRSPSPKEKNDRRKPQLGVIIPHQKGISSPSAPTLSPSSTEYRDEMSPSAARATTVPSDDRMYQSTSADGAHNEAFDSEELMV